MEQARWEQIKQIFNAAMEQPAGERMAFVEQACAGDADLRREVESLIQAARPTLDPGHVQTGGAAAALAKASDSTLASIPISERPGSVVRGYKLLQVIGEGGFGTVFLADQTAPVRRRVALKIIKLGMDTRSVVARFEAERQALALMDHPNIAKVFDAGSTDSGRPYFVMEYVKGDPITLFADAHTLTLRERLELLTQVCLAVQHAHQKGVIHRDIKPSNVLVSMVDGRPLAKVIDFGIAKATASPLTEKTLFTEHRQLIGTPEYMSPEQAEGSPDIDTRTDVYGLGVLMYELLTGTTPFEPSRLRSAAYAEMQRIIKEEEPPSPSLRITRDVQRDIKKLASTAAQRKVEPQKLNALMRGELDWIVMKALDKDRARRFATPQDLGADIERHLRGEAVVAAPASAAYRVRKFVRRNKGAVGASAAIAATLLLGIAGTTWGLMNARRAEARERGTAIEAVRSRDALKAQVESIRGVYDSVAAEIEVAARQGVFPAQVPADPGQRENSGSMDPALARLETMRQYSVEWIRRAVQTHKDVQRQREHAERSAYTANLALAQAAMDAGNYPEARKRLADAPASKRGWEWNYASLKAAAVDWAIGNHLRGLVFSEDGSRVSASDQGVPVIDYSAGTGEQLSGKPVGMRSIYLAGLTTSGDVRVFQPTREQWPWHREPDVRVLIESLTGVQLGQVDYASFNRDGSRLVWRNGVGADMSLPTHKMVPVSQWGGPEGLLDTPVSVVLEHQISVVPAPDVLKSLRVESILASSPSGPSGLTITTPDGTRRIVGGSDKTIRFYEAKPAQTPAPSASSPDAPGAAPAPEPASHELAVFRMPAAVTNLQMTGDGTRLIIHLADGSARVWDIRDPEERRKDLQAKWAERVPAGQYLDTLWNDVTAAGDASGTSVPRIATDKLRDAVIADQSLTPLRRLVAVEMLEERIEDTRLAAESARDTLTKDATPTTDPATIRTTAAAMDLPPRVKAKVLTLLADWKPPSVMSAEEQRLAEETKQRRLAEAKAAMATARDYFEDVASSSDRNQLAQAFTTYEELAGRLAPETIEALIAAALSQRMTEESATMLSDAAERLESVTPEPSLRLVEVWCEAAEAAAFVGRFDEAEKFYARVANAAEGVLRRDGRLSLRHIPFAQYKVPGIDKVHGWMRVGFTEESAGDLQPLLAYFSAARGPSLRQWMASRLSSVARYTAQGGGHVEGLILVNRAISADSDSPSPSSVLALIRHRLSTADDATLAAAAEIDGKPGSLTGGKVLDREGHRAAAREALAKARALMAAPPTLAADGVTVVPNSWANDADAIALLAEAAALIEGGDDGLLPEQALPKR